MSSSQRWQQAPSKLRSQQLWAEFQKLFVTTLNATPACVFAWAWLSAKNRTSFYRNDLLPKVAGGLGLIDAYELFRVDSTFCLREDCEGEQTLIPIIHVESENKAADARHEVRKLCSLTSRLKVLISCDEWSEAWEHGGHAVRYLEKWRGVVRKHHLYNPDDCEMGVIVAERRNKGEATEAIYFYATTLTHPFPPAPARGNLIFSVNVAGYAPCDPKYMAIAKPASDFDLVPGSRD